MVICLGDEGKSSRSARLLDSLFGIVLGLVIRPLCGMIVGAFKVLFRTSFQFMASIELGSIVRNVLVNGNWMWLPDWYVKYPMLATIPTSNPSS